MLINADNKDAGMMGFLIFTVVGLLTSIMTIVCNMGFIYTAWMICLGALGVTGFLIDSPYVGKVDIIEGAGLVAVRVVGSLKDLYDIIKSATQ